MTQPIHHPTSLGALISLILCSVVAISSNAEEKNAQAASVEKTTIETFPLPQLEQEALSKTVIEGGLEPPAAGENPNTSPEKAESFNAETQAGLNNPDQIDRVQNPVYDVRINYRYPRYQNEGSHLVDRYDRVYNDRN